MLYIYNISISQILHKTYIIKNIFAFHLKFIFNWVSGILSGNLTKMTSLDYTLRKRKVARVF